MKRPILSLLLLATLITGLGNGSCLAQQKITINTKQLASDKLQLGWLVKSLVPAGGVQVFAEYQVEISSDLAQWTALTERIVGTPFASSWNFYP